MTTEQASAAVTRANSRRLKPGFVEKTLADISGSIERAIFSEENARKEGFLQRRDPRAKLLAFVVLIIAAGLSREWPVLLGLYGLVLVAAAISSIDLGLFIKRVWLGMGLFSGVVILPSIFFIGHRELSSHPAGFLLSDGPRRRSSRGGDLRPACLRLGVAGDLADPHDEVG